MKNKEPRYPFALDEKGDPVRPEDAIPGVRYRCPTCDSARLIVVRRADGKCYFRSVRGTSHSGSACIRVEDGKGAVKCKAVDKDRLLKNAIRRKTQKKPENPGIRHPRGPRKPSDEVVICSNLQEIREKKLNTLDDFQLNENERLIDHFVSEKNAFRVLNENTSLGVRALEVDFDYILPWKQTVRFTLKADAWQNGEPSAARMVLDMLCETNEEFCIARDRYFIMCRNLNGDVFFLPRYKKAFIVGDFHAVSPEHCRDNHACSKRCRMKYTHCVGRQVAQLLKALGQINVDEADRIDYTYLNGWTEDYE